MSRNWLPSLRKQSDSTDPGWLARTLSALPEGSRLSPAVWERRHRAIVKVALAQTVLVFGFGLWRGLAPLHVLEEVGGVAVLALMARYSKGTSVVRSGYATLSLMLTSAVLVHQAGGITEWHFHFFVMVGLITLYQEWTPFIVAIVFVALHHGVLGMIDPEGVYGTAAAIRAPWKWALLHAAFVLAAAGVHIAAWRISEDQGHTDPLTGLSNRIGFTDLVDRLLERSSRVAVLYVDLDGFKMVNDTVGHDGGDDVLRQIGARMRDALRPGDRASRLGGDEFAVVLQQVDRAQAVKIAQRILLALSDPILLGPQRRQMLVGASVGIAFGEAGVDGVELVRRSDIAMYSAKGNGGGRFAIFDEGLEELHSERAELADDVRYAVERGQLTAVYQPTVDLASGRISGVEALMRWDHPQRGPVSPVRFIPLAERTGAIIAMGEWMLRTAIQQVAQWRSEGLDLSLAVNVSILQLDEPSFADTLFDILNANSVEPTRLTIELTESVLILDIEQTAHRLHLLRERGVRVAIDDFGTGYSSMSYLRRLPVDVVKIDQSFVQGLTSGGTEPALVRSIVELAAALSIEVVAEGIEQDDQADMLRALHCATGLGFLWSRPVPPDQISALCRPSTAVANWQQPKPAPAT
ncbi:MAG: diguanylate cyclase/phosphodiesterase [Acidimicrobiia bacterium]|nr:diguanylate cyclase/phosphodiesterase [Acidimicrobiia bacterium]